MSRLFYAGLYRLRKSKVFLACLFVPPLYSFFLMLSQYFYMKESGVQYSPDSFVFHFLLLTGILMAVFGSLYVGTDYHDGTIRNKLIGGFSRNAIYLSNLLILWMVGILSVLLAYLVGVIGGISFFGMFKMPVEKIVQIGAAGICMTMAYVSIFHMISMVTSNKTNSAVSCILLAILLIIFSGILYSKLVQPEWMDQAIIRDGETIMETVRNPAYITGIKRSVYQNILDFLPSGQTIQILNQDNMNIGRMMIYSVFIIVTANLTGLYLFKQKDIK